MGTMGSLIFVLLAMLHGQQRPNTPPKVIYCGPMFDGPGHYDKATSTCVAKVLTSGRKAVVSVPCKDGYIAGALVWLDDEGLQLQSYEEVCGTHNAVKDGGTE